VSLLLRIAEALGISGTKLMADAEALLRKGARPRKKTTLASLPRPQVASAVSGYSLPRIGTKLATGLFSRRRLFSRCRRSTSFSSCNTRDSKVAF